MPAKQGNINGIKNGARIKGAIMRLNLGELPGTMRRQLSTARKYRRDLEAAVAATKGEVNLIDAHLIDEAVNAETHASVCRWLMRERLDKMSVNDIITCSREILKAKGTRNRAVQKLGLDREQEDLIEALYHVDKTDRVADHAEGLESVARMHANAQEDASACNVLRNDSNALNGKCRAEGTDDK